MNAKHKIIIWRIAVSTVLFGAYFAAKNIEWLGILLIALSYAVIAYDILIDAVKSLFRAKMLDENFLMSVASIGAFAVGEYAEAVAVMLLYQLGELFQSYAVGKSRKNIASLMNLRPDTANVVRNGETLTVDPYEVEIGEEIIVMPGERIPLDGTVVHGNAMADTSALTGESVPSRLEVGSTALSGCICLDGVLKIKVEKEFDESTASKILELVESAASKKAKAENFITKFAKYYTPCVVAAAIALAVIPPLFISGSEWSDWVYRALSFLVISCPCALVISVPLGFFAGIGCASKQGVLIKGSNYMETLSKVKTVIFDKTGTLTKGTFVVTNIEADSMNKEKLLELAALSESFSTHPIAQSIKKAYGKETDKERIGSYEEKAGYGISATIDGKKVLAGNLKLMKENEISVPSQKHYGTTVYIAVDGEYAGCITVSDEIKEDSASAISEIKKLGVKKTVMLTGDNENSASMTAEKLGIDEHFSQLLPAEKVDYTQKIIEKKNKNQTVAFVGDGINDAPALSLSDVGIAMGAMGSDAAIEAADVVIMDDKPSKIASAIKISKNTLNIVRQNIVFALLVKAVVLVLGALGIASMWLAVFADVGVCMIAVINSMRAMKKPK